MKMRPLPPSQSCSATSSRKNSVRPAVLPVVCLFFLLAPQAAPAQAATVEVVRQAGNCIATIVFPLTPSPERLEPIEAGLKSRMVFTVQVMERREGFFSFLGDIILGETTIDYAGYKDFLEDLFVLEDGQGRKTTFTGGGDFFNAFSRVDALPLASLSPCASRPGRYVRVQARYYPVKLVAPLTLIYVFSPRGVIESGWRTAAIPD
jgi:hypothetical protein